MFKFMKSKKGFSLVELMIVVVIMAILVAVAVPIFNSVTGNSRAKTCIDNQRSIISTLNNALLEKTLDAGDEFIFEVSNSAEGERDYTAENAAAYPADNTSPFLKKSELTGLFQTPPYCPVDDSVIRVTITGQEDGTCKVETLCVKNNGTQVDKNPHDLA